MTLIAAFRTDAGAVICADSKESDGDFYVRVDKIGRVNLGAYWAVIGGSGYDGDLIDGLADVLEQCIESRPAGLKESVIRDHISFTLREYHDQVVKEQPIKRTHKLMEFVICVQDKESKEVFLWKTAGRTIRRIKTFDLVGARTMLYHNEVDRLYGREGRPWTARAVALGIHILALAKATSDWVGGPTRVIVATEKGMWPYEPEDVEVLEERARKFSEALADLTLALPDVTVAEGSFVEILGSFEEKVLALRGYYLRRLARSLADRIGSGNTAVRHELPLGASILLGDGRTVFNKADHVGFTFGGAFNSPSDSQKSEDQQLPYTEAYPETDRNASDD